jgi:hypothetical protein
MVYPKRRYALMKGDTMGEAKTMRYGTRLHKHVYTYGMRLRGFSPGCQPKDGLIERRDDKSGLYYDVLVYERELTAKELDYYELDFLGEESWFRQNPS